MPDVDYQTLHPAALTPQATAAWRRLCASDAAFADPLLGPDFARLVGEVRDDARVTVIRFGDDPHAGFWPHHRRPDGLARPIGAPFSDYHAVVTRPDVPFSAHDLMRAAGVRRFRFDGLVDPRGRFADAVQARQPVYAIRLEGRAEDHLEQLRAQSPKRFKNMRRLEHKLEREVGLLELRAPDHDRRAFTALMDWKRRQFERSGLHDVLGARWVRTLMRRLHGTVGGDLGGDFGGLLVMLYAGGKPVAGHFGPRAAGAFHPWVAAFDPDYAAYGPGITLVTRALLAMPAMGLSTYDLSGGSDHYKRPFGQLDETVAGGEMRLGRPAPASRRFDAHPAALTRLARRMDQIAAVEPSLGGRFAGVIGAVRAIPRRLNAGGGEA